MLGLWNSLQLLLHLPIGCWPHATDTKVAHKIKTTTLIRFMTNPRGLYAGNTLQEIGVIRLRGALEPESRLAHRERAQAGITIEQRELPGGCLLETSGQRRAIRFVIGHPGGQLPPVWRKMFQFSPNSGAKGPAHLPSRHFQRSHPARSRYGELQERTLKSVSGRHRSETPKPVRRVDSSHWDQSIVRRDSSRSIRTDRPGIRRRQDTTAERCWNIPGSRCRC